MSDSKICFKCKTNKPLTEYYVHAQMGDGHLNKCIECAKNDARVQYGKNMQNPDWVEREQKRVRLKELKRYHTKLKGTDKLKLKQQIAGRKYVKRYPEKRNAVNFVHSNLESVPGYQYHHWSYKKEHRLDVIQLSISTHNFLHRFITYVPELMCYKTKLGGILLDTKDKHLEFIDFIQYDNTLRIAA
jgi:hypothetical protein